MMTYLDTQLDIRDASFELVGTLTEEGADTFGRFPDPSRVVTVELARGHKWPDEYKRGMVMTMTLLGAKVHARVRFRRLHRLVLDTIPTVESTPVIR